jgi:hypothetical protein
VRRAELALRESARSTGSEDQRDDILARPMGLEMLERLLARKSFLVGLISATLAIAFSCGVILAEPASEPDTDMALVVAVDTSNSVDEHRYHLQIEGIAKALEDPGVIDAIVSGSQGGIFFSLVEWADRPQLSIPWTLISNANDAKRVAEHVRALPRNPGDFTCMATMLRSVADKVVTQIPGNSRRIVIDVSGDGKDDCNSEVPVEAVRDEIVGYGMTVNGLPILEGDEATTLEGWYREHVMGGPGSFVLPANGFADFGRAIRQKFVVEISDLEGLSDRHVRATLADGSHGIDKQAPRTAGQVNEDIGAPAITNVLAYP